MENILNALSEKVFTIETINIIEQKASLASEKALKVVPSNEPLENDKL